jgi:hypothetical protein
MIGHVRRARPMDRSGMVPSGRRLITAVLNQAIVGKAGATCKAGISRKTPRRASIKRA